MPDIEQVMTALRTWARARKAAEAKGYLQDVGEPGNVPPEVADVLAAEDQLLALLPESDR